MGVEKQEEDEQEEKQGGVSFIQCDQPNVVVETWKASEDDPEGLSVLRLYEAYGGAVVARLLTHWDVVELGVCNILEEPQPSTPFSSSSSSSLDEQKVELISPREIKVELRPFQVLSLSVRFGSLSGSAGERPSASGEPPKKRRR
jgi:hypothetical protein